MTILSLSILWMTLLVHLVDFGACAGNDGTSIATLPRVGQEQYGSQQTSDLIALNILKFSQNLGYELGKDYSQTQIFSPLSIVSVLALLLLGSKGNSFSEIAKLLGVDNDGQYGLHSTQFHEEFYKLMGYLEMDISAFKNVPLVNWRNSKNPESLRNNVKLSKTPNEHVVKVANGLFINYGTNVNEDYKQAIQSVYRSKVAILNFQNNKKAAKNYINSWANQNTFSKIRNIISDDISDDTNMIAANVLYFKGYWEQDFFDSATTQSEFYPDGLSKPPVNVMMMATGGNFPYHESIEDDCRIIGLPYKGNLSTLYIIQPHNSSRDKLRRMQGMLTAEKIENLISNMVLRVAIIAFPKLHIKDSINLKEILTKMGASSLFSNQLSDFSIINAENEISTRLGQTIIQNFPMLDRYNETPLIFSRFGDEVLNVQTLQQNTWNAPLPPEVRNPKKVTRLSRIQRQVAASFNSKDVREALYRLDLLRHQNKPKTSDLYVKDIKHKVDLVINEQGTEAAAATVTSLKRSGPEILFRAETPFLMLLRHDVTKLPLFYGVVNDPTNLS